MASLAKGELPLRLRAPNEGKRGLVRYAPFRPVVCLGPESAVTNIRRVPKRAGDKPPATPAGTAGEFDSVPTSAFKPSATYATQ
jgi:hypothetical protein